MHRSALLSDSSPFAFLREEEREANRSRPFCRQGSSHGKEMGWMAGALHRAREFLALNSPRTCMVPLVLYFASFKSIFVLPVNTGRLFGGKFCLNYDGIIAPQEKRNALRSPSTYRSGP